jgi:hypothetical protein
MITLFGALLGFLGSLMPEVLKLFRDVQDRKHELAILDRQLEAQRQGYAQRLEEIQTMADISESQALYKTYNTGVNWVDALNGTVRPVLAYAFFVLYAVVKIMQIYLAKAYLHLSGFDILPYIWNIEDQAIFAGIISFYFGQRAMGKLRGR